MRFTVRRPPNGEVSPCCHRPSGGDVACSVDVGVAPASSAGFALENRLALAVPGRDVPTRRASLRRIRGRDLLDWAVSLVLQTRSERPPTTAADRTVEPAFCATRTPGCSTVPRAERVIARTSRASILIESNRRAISVVAFSTQSLRRSPSRAFSFAIARLVRARRLEPRLARASRCCNTFSRFASPWSKTGCVQQFAGRQCRRHGDSTVDTDHAVVAWTGRPGRGCGRTRYASGRPDHG